MAASRTGVKSLKDYLKKYENSDVIEKKKKKKKPSKPGVLVVDEDPVWQKQVDPVEEEKEDDSEEEMPVVDEDIEVRRMRRLEEIKARRAHKRRRVISSDPDSIVLDEQFKRTLLCVAKPSYILGLGPKASRSEYLKGLPNIFRELLRQRNWKEASQLLSVLMLGTMRDGSPKINRLKYEAQIQILSHLQPNKKKKAEEIGKVYDTWIGKIGKQHKEERLLVWFEQICHFIDHGIDVDAYSAAISMMQNRDLGSLPRSNLFIGITFYKMWYSKFLKELQPEDADCDESISNMSESRSNNLIEYPVGDESVYTMESQGSVRNESETSVMNYKKASHMSISDSGTKMDVKVKLESLQPYNNPTRLVAISEESEVSLQDGVARTFDPTLIKILGDMDPWLLPLKPPEDPDYYVKMVNDSYYKDAVKHLRLTIQSPLHVSLAALHPLVQMLLIGGHVDEAMKVVEEMCNNVHDIKPFRIKAAMMEKFHSNSDTLAKSYEDILKIDPNCGTTLKKLIAMSIEDGYSKESLIEMIALHVEASYPEPEIWKELASCFIHFFENLDEDRMSVCLNGSGEERNQQRYSVRFNPTPKMFTDTSWTLRAKLWLYRHFSPEMLETEIKNGDLEMMSYKAACASHIYGREFGYVTKVFGLLEKENNKGLFSFLRTHRRNWNKIYNLDSSTSVDTSKAGEELTHGEENGASSSDQKTVTEKENTITEDSAVDSSESSKSCDEIAFNPNVFTDFTLGGTQEEIVADEENVKKVSSYLLDVVLPKFIEDLCTLEVSPMDGQTLTEALHAHGVNVRYIGRVANGVKHLPHLWDLCLNEIAARSAKHILKDILRDIEDHDIGAAVSHFLNCFFGNYQAAGGKASANAKNQKKDQSLTKKGQGRGKGKSSAKKSISSYMMVDSNILWSDIQEFAKAKYEFELPELSRSKIDEG